MAKAKTEEKLEFQAEVAKVLDLVIHSLYSNKEIFLRELISNASDACDKLRYLSLTESNLIDPGTELGITLSVNEKAKSLTISDNGIGMNHDELIENLGTIARSGTTAFLESLSGDEKKDADLIGQFGVGFYSCFSVAKKVEVITKRAGEDQAWLWASEGAGSFTIVEAERDTQGSTVTVYFDKDNKEYLEEARIRNIVKTYSDHISLPINLATTTEKEGKEEASIDQLNSGSAIWTRGKSDITEEQYKEFYHHVGHVFDDPWLTLHNRVEGKIEYTNLLYVPSSPPFDLMNPERKHKVKLYVKRVFITDDCEDLMPGYLRFVRGIVDSEDLPLNVSREMLQHNVLVGHIKKALVKRIFSELKKKATKKPEEYANFWNNFGAVLKEGLYEDHDNRDTLLELTRFNSTLNDDLLSLEDYVGRMNNGQEEIFYITGDDAQTLKTSPQIEGFKSKGVEVLLLTDPVDEFWLSMVGQFNEKPFKSVTSGDIDLGAIKRSDDAEEEKEKPEAADDADIAKLLIAFKEELGEAVKDVRASDRLTDSAVCLVAGEGDMDLHLARMLKQQGHMDVPSSARVLEINSTHALIKKLSGLTDDLTKKEDLQNMAHLLLDQARIIEGEAVADPAAFSKRLNTALAKGLV
ncbi:MAG: molecular chaperone HtpG [Rhodospirillaceae bacterium]|jgi:molecular chaperone HtpG|nr:molecular chaperone HtpG [Rhodospirillaceae bacterium]MBT4589573.1 molecular chaperone HtpG [Rhodospirillaceae bacterium]MBT5941024.1 molecular chaperone HtpG [Rhodospirillaceae bacterium]MBT7265574.1 molecular chaperone HtpG [Rhodospirillaceae bacterium]